MQMSRVRSASFNTPASRLLSVLADIEVLTCTARIKESATRPSLSDGPLLYLRFHENSRKVHHDRALDAFVLCSLVFIAFRRSALLESNQRVNPLFPL